MSGTTSEMGRRRNRGALAAALAAAVLSLVVYLATAAPTVMLGDSGELQTVALLGGVGHPSGYPTFIMLGHVFGRLVPGDPAHRITVMSAVFGGLGVLFFGLLLAELGLSAAGVLAGTLLFGGPASPCGGRPSAARCTRWRSPASC